MYRCPECGTEYTVVPEACAVCGHETDASEHIDLFAAAQEQERQAAAILRERQDEYRRQREAKAAAKNTAAKKAEEKTDSTPSAHTSGNGIAFPELENASASEKAQARIVPGESTAPGKSAGSEKPGIQNTGMKLAAVGCAAALALGGGVYAFSHGKPPGFQKSTVGTFYLKGTALWFQNGRNARTICLNDKVFAD
ncbi:MAG: hypothetical protein K5705_11800, partial [Oscillospiraceae bacterium]|nr:hypothetical protein [Oscillospiraceae bacterium]